jgi:glycosyltransferase involved in cell wall biosynthesis
MTSPTPPVAALLTCYNEGPYIGAAVRSVLEQSRADCIESIVIADDGSNADTLAVLRQIEGWDSRIRIHYGPGGSGLPAQRNLAIRSTTAPVLAILDGDDIWAAHKLELQLPALLAAEDVGLVYAGYLAFCGDHTSGSVRARVRDISGESDLQRAYFLCDPPIIPSTTLIRRSMFEACGGFDASIRVFEDTDFYLRLARICRFSFIEQPLLFKRSGKSTITGGRRDLIAHHAFVALKAASERPALLPLVPRRLCERARKLANHRLLLGQVAEARYLLHLAVKLDPANLRVWLSLLASSPIARPLQRLMAARIQSRRSAMGGGEQCP